MRDLIGDAWEDIRRHVEEDIEQGAFEMSKQYGVYGLDEQDDRGDELPLVVWLEDEPRHSFSQPYCSEESCPCHTDEALFAEYIERPMLDGLLTSWEASRLQWGDTL
jgi:hypothetical protein